MLTAAVEDGPDLGQNAGMPRHKLLERSQNTDVGVKSAGHAPSSYKDLGKRPTWKVVWIFEIEP